jgi:hypothetical protein
MLISTSTTSIAALQRFATTRRIRGSTRSLSDPEPTAGHYRIARIGNKR